MIAKALRWLASRIEGYRRYMVSYDYTYHNGPHFNSPPAKGFGVATAEVKSAFVAKHGVEKVCENIAMSSLANDKIPAVSVRVTCAHEI
jgi:hypothetical protein